MSATEVPEDCRMKGLRGIERKLADYYRLTEENETLRAALSPFAHYYDLNDCTPRDKREALEVPIRDLYNAKRALGHQQQARPAGTPCQRTPCKYPNCQCA